MEFIYHQGSGELFVDGNLLARGYSGQPPHVNVTEDEALHNLGPIPRGKYLLAEIVDGTHLGPRAIRLTPCEGTQTFGRGGFFVHGDEVKRPGWASHGCICIARAPRERLAEHLGEIITVK